MNLRGGILLSSLLVATPAIADGVRMDPGRWEFHNTAQMPMGMQPRSTVTTECVTESEIDPKRFMQNSAGCSLTDMKADGSSMTWNVSCPGPEGAMTGRGELHSSGAGMNGKMTMTMSHQGQTMEMAVTWEGKRLGPCE
jgi:hypothetical protein